MAIYDFGCMNCERTISVSQSINKKLTTPICARCGYRMIRSFGIGSVKFNGSGWASKDK